jgi:hypothetical protein
MRLKGLKLSPTCLAMLMTWPQNAAAMDGAKVIAASIPSISKRNSDYF